MVKNLLLDPILVHLTQIPATNFFFQNLTFLVTRYHGQLCTILEKTNDLILRKCIDGRTDGWMDGLEDRWIRLDLKNYCCHLALGLRVG